jgi:hypothetical protein
MVKKSATVYSNDSGKKTIILYMEGKVRPLIELKPSNVVAFRGVAAQQEARTVDIVASSQPFHIQKMESDLNGKISYKLETVEDGQHYRLKITNLEKKGYYTGYIKFLTDMPKKPQILVSISGLIEGEIAVRPLAIRIGKLVPGRPAFTGKVLVIDNLKRPFKISKLTYDKNLLQVDQQPLPNEPGYTLTINPILDGLPPGVTRQQATLEVETDASPADKFEVHVDIFNSADVPRAAQSRPPVQQGPPTRVGAQITPGNSIPPAGAQ